MTRINVYCILMMVLFLAACSQTTQPTQKNLETQGLVFNVTSLADKPDFNPGDGVCAAWFPGGWGGCTLRAAVEEANTSAGPDNIVVPSGLYVLSKGSLKISDDVVMTGAGRYSTIIDASDKAYVFEISNGPSEESFQVELHHLTARNASYTGIMNIGADLLIHKSIVTDNNPTTYANSAG
jgi:CSLREA domain-containing protein